MPTARSINLYPSRFEAARPLGFGGTGTVSGTTAVTGTPNAAVSRRVRLHDFETGLVAREMWSDTSGAYLFVKLAAGDYYVTAFDQTGTYNAVIADKITITG